MAEVSGPEKTALCHPHLGAHELLSCIPHHTFAGATVFRTQFGRTVVKMSYKNRKEQAGPLLQRQLLSPAVDCLINILRARFCLDAGRNLSDFLLSFFIFQMRGVRLREVAHILPFTPSPTERSLLSNLSRVASYSSLQMALPSLSFS